MTVPKCNAGHRLPDVVGYVYPHGTLVCTGCQTFDAFIHGGSPTVTTVTTDGQSSTFATYAVKRGELSTRPLPHRCAWCRAPLPAPCAQCDPAGAERLRQQSMRCVPHTPFATGPVA